MLDDLSVLETLFASLRAIVLTEFSSIWLPLQIGAIVVVALIAFAIAVPVRRIAVATSNFIDRRLHTFTDLTPSIQELIAKLVRIAKQVIQRE